jgi:thioredoxin reductase
MTVDCAIIGGGPAGLNAALVLGRARRKVLLSDDNNPRNAVTWHSQGFIICDGVTPARFLPGNGHRPYVSIHVPQDIAGVFRTYRC